MAGAGGSQANTRTSRRSHWRRADGSERALGLGVHCSLVETLAEARARFEAVGAAPAGHVQRPYCAGAWRLARAPIKHKVDEQRSTNLGPTISFSAARPPPSSSPPRRLARKPTHHGTRRDWESGDGAGPRKSRAQMLAVKAAQPLADSSRMRARPSRFAPPSQSACRPPAAQVGNCHRRRGPLFRGPLSHRMGWSPASRERIQEAKGSRHLQQCNPLGCGGGGGGGGVDVPVPLHWTPEPLGIRSGRRRLHGMG